jgi:hypothetical protein
LNIEETGKILAVIKKEYPHEFKDFSVQDKRAKVAFWQDMFADDDYGVVGAAVKSYIATDTTGYAPKVGQLKALIRKLTQPDEMSEQEAVNLILKAASRSNYGAKEEFEKLPPICQRLAGSPARLREWASMDRATVNSVVASNLMRSYKAIAEKEREYQALPSNVKAVLEGIKNNMRLEGGKESVLENLALRSSEADG